MKKIFGLLAAFLLLSGCDDGDMTFKTFSFDDSATVQRCTNSNIYYKAQDTQVLILTLNPLNLINVASESEIVNGETVYTPRLVAVTATGENRLIYRNYSGNVTSSSGVLCSAIPASSPTVLEEWNGDGTISIITIPIMVDGQVTRYNHIVTLVDVSFSKDDETIRILDNDFGAISTELGYDFDFGTEETPLAVTACDDNRIFVRNTTNALVFDIDNSYFTNTTEGTEEVELDFGDTVNLYVYSGSITTDVVCANTPSVSPTVVSIWELTEGTVQITTDYDETNGVYNYTIRLYDAVFTNTGGNGESFSPLPNNESAEGYYFVGTYSVPE